MFKKLLSVFMVITLCLSGVTAFAENDVKGDVSISFRLGESTLMINGNPVEVETPFATESGTTLVPLRVITEAFGAEVLWSNEDQKITLTYPDVNIVLQIGNPYAEINAHTEQLPEAPVLSANGVTMVPLRFISDTYGAEVIWDNGLITVTKKADTEYGDIVKGMADSDKIGDSYHGWVMNNPKSLVMSDRDFDGSYVSFTNDNYDDIDIYVTQIEEYTDSFDTYYNSVKSMSSDLVLVRQEKFTDANGNRGFVVHAKDEEYNVYFRCYYTEDKIYEVASSFSAEDNAQRDSFLSILDSFELAPLTDDVYDLSDVSENGTRTFKDEKYKVSFDVPAEFFEVSMSENSFAFASNLDMNYIVALSIYSKSETKTVQSFVEHDNASKKKYLNPKLATVSDITTEEINGVSVSYYTSTISGSMDRDSVEVDYFFENGDYIYNFTVSAKTKEDADAIFNTLKTEPLDTEEIGPLLRDDGDNSENITLKSTSWSLDMPGNWMNDAVVETGVIMTNIQSSILFIKAPMTGSETTREVLNAVIEQQMALGTVKQSGNIKTVVINNKSYQTVTLKNTADGELSYATIYVSSNKGSVVTFILVENELFYGAGSMDDFIRIIESLKLQ